jgi:hypothetical protein
MLKHDGGDDWLMLFILIRCEARTIFEHAPRPFARSLSRWRPSARRQTVLRHRELWCRQSTSHPF